MKESLNLSQKQQMVQRLSPHLVQFVKLLEMTAPEVEEEVRRQLDDNPALEAVSDTPNEFDASNGDDGVDAYEGLTDYSDNDARYKDEAGDNDYSYSDDDSDYSHFDYDKRTGWQIAADSTDLAAFLSDQIAHTLLPDNLKQLAGYIIGNLDESGYLTRSLSAMANDIAISSGHEVDMSDMRKAFDAVRELDPAGIGAVDLRDCLLLQLNRRKPNSLPLRIAKEIVKDNFDLLSKMHYDRLQAQLGIDGDSEDLHQALEIIRSLNPKPGAAIGLSESASKWTQIAPDVMVERISDDRYSVSLASRLPRLQIEKTFDIGAQDVSKPTNKRERDAQAFLRLKRDEAEAFISALKLRGETLLGVTEAIVRRQPEFFRTGDSSKLRPMILKDIANDTGIDLSAVSRATAGKYVATELGTYPLKMFFNEAPTESADTSSHELMHALKDIVDNEDKKHPLTDQALHEAMQGKGYKLARRTVTKYREKLGIPVGRLRKRI